MSRGPNSKMREFLPVGIMKGAKSTPNINDACLAPREMVPNPKNVKFVYVSPADKWGTRKKLASRDRSQSMESVATSIGYQNRPQLDLVAENQDQARPGRSRDRPSPSKRGISRERSTTRLQEDVSFYIAHISQFLNDNPWNNMQMHLVHLRMVTVTDFTTMSISQYFEVIRFISASFDRDFFSLVDRVQTLYGKNRLFSLLTMNLAKKIGRASFISPTLLTRPMTQSPGCDTTKKKLRFLSHLVTHAEEEMERQRRAAIEDAIENHRVADRINVYNPPNEEEGQQDDEPFVLPRTFRAFVI